MAYYSPIKGGPGTPGYYAYGTQSDSAPGNGWNGKTALATKNNANQANYLGTASSGRYAVTGTTTSIISTSNQNVLTDVGTFTNSASYYGAFDMSGNVCAWNDLDGTTGPSRGRRGGNFGDFFASGLSSSSRFTLTPVSESGGIGFCLVSPVPEPASLGLAAAGGPATLGWTMLRRRSPRATS
ncbi:MAG: PEP-CTERM sorting domain-containing protein [Planctomycetes bacterium]|nr:PEP-CTERM sorting domain-containing protein [Planctomycetota bacterium]